MSYNILDMIQNGAKIVDVRTPGEFAGGSYPGSVNIPVDEVEARIDEFGDKSGGIIVYCASGGRSGMAENILRGAGYTNVVNGGGIASMPRA